VHVDELWFWSPDHHAAEREAEEDLERGRYRDFDDPEGLLADLESIVDQTQPGDISR
jgi:hypothetical protein